MDTATSPSPAAATPAPKAVAEVLWCASHAEPHYTEAQLQAMTDAELAEANAVQDQGEAICGW